MRYFFLVLFFLFKVSFIFSQDEKIKSLVTQSEKMNLDMWDLTDFAEENLTDKKDLAKFFYYWIGSNIKYDNTSLKNRNENLISLKQFSGLQDEFNVFKNRKGVCSGYANLYNWFMDQIDIESIYITGYIRDKRNHYVELSKDEQFGHAWNAIKINSEWLLVDTTWGTSNDEAQSEFYFDIKPELAIISHYPEKSEWQLLKKPLSLTEFNKSKFVSPLWFFKGFSDVPKLKSDSNYYYLVFKSNIKTKWKVVLLSSTNNIDFNIIKDTKLIHQDRYTYIRFGKNQVPKKCYYKINLREIDGYSYREYSDIINFKTY